MSFEAVLTSKEIAALSLRELYASAGFSRFVCRRFDEYSLYADNKEFLSGLDIITFSGKDGELLALRPDVTLPIVKAVRARELSEPIKLYYHESVYRKSGLSREYRELSQVGAEVIGVFDGKTQQEVLSLAFRSLNVLRNGREAFLDVSHVGIIKKTIDHAAARGADGAALAKHLSRKNIPGLLKLPGIEQNAPVVRLAALYGQASEVMPELTAICAGIGAQAEAAELAELCKGEGGESIRIDFSVGNGLHYYSGLVFDGFIAGETQAVLSGGRYDGLLRNFGYPKEYSAVGFAVYLDKIRGLDEN
ncbi:MAG: ATP phosphoribosyltransferase regulatory subunit [Oscillospiraceae bacterium]|jgi:ATP phosphoribosyltransferase regulatory subunit|nr:ATP phosphoribosyltransferase regulatory subunit [Oscillospiraceae bacterium]